ncbi:DUF6350 family protein [Microbacterium sp. NPDC057659]|uniref:cell division protein PerM n=1 Tax=Microbacterium sp. NPDC057659 TaxID=3346198 RepID=UPI00366FF6CF
MQRLTVALLAALDAAIAAAIGLAVLLAPLTLLWTIAIGATADWGALWPASGTLWQFGHGAAMQIQIPDEVIRATGIAPAAARFTLSLTPLALLLFTLLFAARSGRRASAAGAWISGVVGGTVVFAAVSLLVALTAGTPAAHVAFWVGALLPVAVYLAGLLAGAVKHAWSEGDGGPIDRLHDVVDSWGDWAPVPAEAVRGAAVTVVVLTGVGALGVAAMTVLRGGEVIALFESAHVDALGATVITLGQLAYLPTLVVWAVAWIAGPGFAVGAGTAVSPAGTQLGVVPGIPVLGLLPPVDSFWMLVVVLIPIAAGALAGWMIRSKLVWEGGAVGYGPRAAIAAGIALISAGVAALAAVLASGSIGPGRLTETGPQPGGFALAIGLEVLVGAAILLLAPRHRDELAEERTDRWHAEMAEYDHAHTGERTSGQDTPGTRVD